MITEKIKATLKNSQKKYITKTNAYLNEENDILYYVEDDDEKTVVELDVINKILRRDNNKILLEYQFNLDSQTESFIIDKELNQTLKINIKTSKFDIKDNIIEIEYFIDEEKFIYKVEKEK